MLASAVVHLQPSASLDELRHCVQRLLRQRQAPRLLRSPAGARDGAAAGSHSARPAPGSVDGVLLGTRRGARSGGLLVAPQGVPLRIRRPERIAGNLVVQNPVVHPATRGGAVSKPHYYANHARKRNFRQEGRLEESTSF